MLRRNWVDSQNTRVLPAASFRRPPPKDRDGLSLGYGCPVAQYKLQFREVFGAATLHVGHVRQLGKLDVVADPALAHHALLVNLPDCDVDPVAAERLASQLARHARLVAT